MPNYVLNEAAIIDIGRMKSDIRSLFELVNRVQDIADSSDSSRCFLVEAAEDIPAATDDTPGVGLAWVVRRWGEDLDLTVGDTKLQVINKGGEIASGTRFNVSRDPWGDYHVIDATATLATSFFKTPTNGIPAAVDVKVPVFRPAERLIWTGLEIESYDPPQFEQLGNHVTADIGGDKIVQAKKINGDWFIDVEPCQ